MDHRVKIYGDWKLACWNLSCSMEVQNYAQPNFRPAFGPLFQLICQSVQKNSCSFSLLLQFTFMLQHQNLTISILKTYFKSLKKIKKPFITTLRLNNPNCAKLILDPSCTYKLTRYIIINLYNLSQTLFHAYITRALR